MTGGSDGEYNQIEPVMMWKGGLCLVTATVMEPHPLACAMWG